MSKIIKPPCVILFCLLACSSLRAAPLMVSPDGPISTLEEARLQVRELKKKQAGQPIEVLIKGGVYPLRETVVFGLEDSGLKVLQSYTKRPLERSRYSQAEFQSLDGKKCRRIQRVFPRKRVATCGWLRFQRLEKRTGSSDLSMTGMSC